MKWNRTYLTLASSTFTPLFEGDGDPGNDPGNDPGKDPGKDPGGTPKTFTNDDVEKMVQERLSKQNKAFKDLQSEFETLNRKTQMTAQERKELEERYEQIQQDLLTKEELSKREKEKAEKAHKKQVEELSTDLEKWKSRYTDSTIQRDITDAAAKHKAFNPKQIVAMVRQQAKLVEELQDNKPTGRLVTRITMDSVDEKGNPVQLTLAPEKAVERMKEMEEFENLFDYEGKGGFGGSNRGKGSGSSDAASLAKTDPKKYMELRKAGKINL